MSPLSHHRPKPAKTYGRGKRGGRVRKHSLVPVDIRGAVVAEENLPQDYTLDGQWVRVQKEQTVTQFLAAIQRPGMRLRNLKYKLLPPTQRLRPGEAVRIVSS